MQRGVFNHFAYNSIFQLRRVLGALASEKKKEITKAACDRKLYLDCVHLACFLFTFHPAQSYGLRGNSLKPPDLFSPVFLLLS